MKDLLRYFIEASGEAAERAAEIAKQLAPLAALYLRALGWLMLAVLAFPLPLLILGIAGNLGWLVSIVGIFWALATFLLLFIAAPLGILIEAVLGSVKGSGRRYVQLALGILCVELTFALFVTVVPVGANWRIIPLLIVAAGILGILGAKGTKTILTKRVVSVAVSAIFILLTLSLFYPKTFSVLQEAIPRSDEQIAGGFVAQTPQTSPMPTGQVEQRYPAAVGDTTRIHVPLNPDQWSEEIVTPLGTTCVFEGPSEAQVRFRDGSEGPITKWWGVKRGIFRFRGPTGMEVVISIFRTS